MNTDNQINNQNTQKRSISSMLTVFYKFILPFLNMFFLIVIMLPVFQTENYKMENLLSNLPVFIIFGIIIIFVVYIYSRIKKVEIDANNLYISNFRETITVPLYNVDKITQNVLLNPEIVKVWLKNDTQFGNFITFCPTYRYFAFFSKHPVVKELENKILFSN